MSRLVKMVGNIGQVNMFYLVKVRFKHWGYVVTFR